MMDKAYQLTNNVQCIILERDGLILNLATRTYFAVNEAGNQILRVLGMAKRNDEAGLHFDTLQKVLVSLFDVSEQTATADLEKFLINPADPNNSLMGKGIIEETQNVAVLPAPPSYPYERRGYRAPILEESPGEFNVESRDEYTRVWPKILTVRE